MLLDAPALSLDADCAGDGRAGGLDGVGTRAVLVAVRDCDFHGETVAEGLVWGQWGRVRVSGNGKRRRRPCAAPLPRPLTIRCCTWNVNSPMRWGTETPCAAPLWIPAFAGTTMGVCGSASAGSVGVRGPPSSALRTGFDRLRANGLGERPFDGVWGMRLGGDAPRRTPLDTGFRRYDDGGVRGPPSSALRTGFDRLRANGLGERAYDGE